MKYYYESIGECVNQVYPLKAKNWDDAKKEAFFEMSRGDRLAEVEEGIEAVLTYDNYPDYRYLDEAACAQIASLDKGTWAEDGEWGEYWEDRAWYFDDAPETYYDDDFTEFMDWRNNQKDDFLEMVKDWQTNTSPLYDDLIIDDPEFEDGEWTATAEDERCSYLLHAVDGNIIIDYLGTK